MALQLEANWATFPKHYSTWLGVAVIIFDSVYVFTDALALSPQTMVLINAAVPVGMKILQLLKQSIPVPPEVKEEMKETLRVLPTTKPEPSGPALGSLAGATPRPQSARQYIDEQIDRKLLEIEKRIVRKKRAPRTKALAAEFVKDTP